MRCDSSRGEVIERVKPYFETAEDLVKYELFVSRAETRLRVMYDVV